MCGGCGGAPNKKTKRFLSQALMILMHLVFGPCSIHCPMVFVGDLFGVVVAHGVQSAIFQSKLRVPSLDGVHQLVHQSTPH